MKQIFWNCWILILLIGMCDCKNKYTCDDPLTLSTTSFAFSIVDKMNLNNLYPASSGSIFQVDTLKIAPNSSEKREISKIVLNGNYKFSFQEVFDVRKDKFDSNICKEFYLYLNQNDTDTLKICFSAVKDECLGSYFQNFEVYYNGILNYRSTSFNETFFDVTLKK